jgi:uncharacterized protein
LIHSQSSQETTDFEIVSSESSRLSTTENTVWKLSSLNFLVAGIFFGVLLIKAEVVSWYRIQEMFRFQSFHMYGVIGSAVGIGAFSFWILKRFQVKTISGHLIEIPEKKFHKGIVFGGLLFGFGWALTGACPGPLFALIGNGAYVFVIALLSAIAGTWFYGAIKNRLPH